MNGFRSFCVREWVCVNGVGTKSMSNIISIQVLSHVIFKLGSSAVGLGPTVHIGKF